MEIMLLVLLSWYTQLVIDKNGGFYYDDEKRPNNQSAHFLTDCFVVCASWTADAKQAKKAEVSTHYYKKKKTFKYAQVKNLSKAHMKTINRDLKEDIAFSILLTCS